MMLRTTTKLLQLRSALPVYRGNVKPCLMAGSFQGGLKIVTLREMSTLGRQLSKPLTRTPATCCFQTVRQKSDDTKKETTRDDKKLKFHDENPKEVKTGEEVFYEVPAMKKWRGAASKTTLGGVMGWVGFTLASSLGKLSVMTPAELFLTIGPVVLGTYLFNQYSGRITNRCDWIMYNHDTKYFTLGQASKWFPFLTTETKFKKGDLTVPDDPVKRLIAQLKVEQEGGVEEMTLKEKVTSSYRVPDPDPFHYLFKEESNEIRFYLTEGYFMEDTEFKSLFIKQYDGEGNGWSDRYVLGKLWEHGVKELKDDKTSKDEQKSVTTEKEGNSNQ